MKEITPRNTPPFRFDVVGSFLRPERLKTARAAFTAGQIQAAELKQVEDEEITQLIAHQIASGLHAITDGEFRRSWWHLDFMWGLNGVEQATPESGYQFQSEVTRAETARLTGKISGENHPFVDHFKFVQSLATDGVIARQTIPAPAQFLAEIDRPENRPVTDQFYPDREALYTDIAAAYKQVIEDLYAAGCRNVQFDDCTWGMLCDPEFAKAVEAAGGSIQAIADVYLHVNNLALAGLPADLTMTTHVCRGNYHSTWASSGGYAPIAETLFGKENVTGYYLEFDTDRAGDFQPLQHVSDGKLVVLGLVSSKIGELEDKAQIIARINEAAKVLPLDRLCLSPQCGFASTEEGNILTEAQQWDKIAFIREIAEEVWGS